MVRSAEKTTKPTVTEQKHYVYVKGAAMILHTQRSVGSNDTRYIYHDHLGSNTLMLDESGNLTERLSYDAQGKRRFPTGSDDTGATLSGIATDRGFTEHEHLDELGLIHMNGRLYDPRIGRFVSPDPAGTSLANPQSLNRFSYVFNKPLIYRDPSGYWPEGASDDDPDRDRVYDVDDPERFEVRVEDGGEIARDRNQVRVTGRREPPRPAPVMYVPDSVLRSFVGNREKAPPCGGPETQIMGGLGGLVGSGVPGPGFAFPAFFVGASVMVGVTSNGGLFIQIQGNVGAGIGMFAGAGAQGGVSRSANPLTRGFSSSDGVQIDANAGYGPSVGGSFGADIGGTAGSQFGVPGLGRYGFGVGAQASLSQYWNATYASGPGVVPFPGGCRE